MNFESTRRREFYRISRRLFIIRVWCTSAVFELCDDDVMNKHSSLDEKGKVDVRTRAAIAVKNGKFY